MTNANPNAPESTPAAFPNVTPTGDLGGHRESIHYALGGINANIQHLTEEVRASNKKLEKFSAFTKQSFEEQRQSIQEIKDKVLVAETQVASAFYTSKWFLAFIGMTVAFLWTNYHSIAAFFNKH